MTKIIETHERISVPLEEIVDGENFRLRMDEDTIKELTESKKVTTLLQRTAVTRVDCGRYKVVPLELIDDGYQLRMSMDIEKIQALAESIKANGLLHPLLVKETPDGRYLTIAGHRRGAAARLAGLQEIPVIITNRDNPSLLAVLENLQREDLILREEALALWQLVKTNVCKQVDLCRMLKKKKSHISIMVKLGKLVEERGNEVQFTDLAPSTYLALVDSFQFPDRFQFPACLYKRLVSVQFYILQQDKYRIRESRVEIEIEVSK